MRTVLAYPGNMMHAQQIARALDERGALEAYVTTFVFRRQGRLASLVKGLPSSPSHRLMRQLARRSINEVPPDKVHSFPLWELVRTGIALAGAGARLSDRAWDRMSHSFDAMVARRYVQRARVVCAFEYTALAAFERAKREGVARVLHLPSLDSRSFEEIQESETRLCSALKSPDHRYFAAQFPRRYARRQREIALADVIVTNSSLTARSHIAAGADPEKVRVAVLGAPPPIEESDTPTEARTGPLRVIWAGPFSLRKGAHHVLEAWRRLNAASAASLEVYGVNALPARLLECPGESVRFYGSVPQQLLFDAYKQADVLVFPTLSDGFGMVIAEAFAHALPVITTDRAGAADLVTADNGLVVPAGDPVALAEALRWCLDNRMRLHEMRLHALHTAQTRQWSHFRHDLISGLDAGLRQAGYRPSFGSITEEPALGR